MSKPLKEYVQQVLAEHDRSQKLRQSMEYADGMVRALPISATWRRKGTRRAIFWEFAVDKFVELTQGDPGLHVEDHHDTVSFIFDDAVLIRLKKAGMSLRTSNYPTPTAELFHQPDADMFGFTGLQRVEAVYIPNQFDTGIIWIGVVAREGTKELWHMELAPPVAAPAAIVVPPTPASVDELVEVKKEAKNPSRKQDGNGHR